MHVHTDILKKCLPNYGLYMTSDPQRSRPALDFQRSTINKCVPQTIAQNL